MPTTRRPDRLTIGRMLILVAGLSLGLVLLQPAAQETRWNSDYLVALWGSIAVGFSLPAPLFTISRLRARRRLHVGAVFATTLGLGAWLLLPPALAVRWLDGDGIGLACAIYVPALVSVWMLAALLLAGKLRRRYLGARAPWSERYGIYLAMIWFPLGVWLTWTIYADSLW